MEGLEVYNRLKARYIKEGEKIEDPLVRRITRKSIETVDTPIYAALVQQATGDESQANYAHRLVLMEANYVLYLDMYYETQEQKYKGLAVAQREKLRSELTEEQEKALSSLERRLFTYWELEKKLGQAMRNNEQIEGPVIDKFSLMKSTDVYLNALITSFFSELPSTVITRLYQRQLLRDLEDDIRDLSEDFEQGMPNPILLRMSGSISGDTSQEDLLQLAKLEGALETQKRHIAKNVTLKGALDPTFAWLG